MWVFDEDVGMNQREVTYVPGLYKIFDEILGEWRHQSATWFIKDHQHHSCLINACVDDHQWSARSSGGGTISVSKLASGLICVCVETDWVRAPLGPLTQSVPVTQCQQHPGRKAHFTSISNCWKTSVCSRRCWKLLNSKTENCPSL